MKRNFCAGLLAAAFFATPTIAFADEPVAPEGALAAGPVAQPADVKPAAVGSLSNGTVALGGVVILTTIAILAANSASSTVSTN